MRKLKKLLIAVMCMLLAVSPAMTVTVSAGSTTGKSAKGWVITSDGQRKYRKNGKFVKGCQKIGKNYYFFNAKNIMQRKNVSFKGATYYIKNNGCIQGVKKGSRYMTPNGKKLSSGKISDLRAYQSARRIVNGITDPHMSKAEKLKACYMWAIRSNGYGGWRKLSDGGNYWYAINANDLFNHRRGDCISYACAMAYMAKVIGYNNVNVCSRDTRAGNHHTWTEINGRVYDSYFGKRRGIKKYYGISYNKYAYKVVFRKRIP